MATRNRLAAIAVGLVLLAAGSASAIAAEPTPGAKARLTILNQCPARVWAVFTPGGTPNQVAVKANSGAWFRPYATQEHFIDTGAEGTIGLSSKTLTLTTPPSDSVQFFVAGQIVEIKGAGTGGGDLITTIDAVSQSKTVLTLHEAATTAVMAVPIWYDTLTGALPIGAGGEKTFAIPAGGAPGANFRFYIGCPSLTDDTDPFTNSGCVVGAQAGDLSGINTLFEPTFGCIKGTSAAQCAFNPADPSAACQQYHDAAHCKKLDSTDYFDISAVDGYTLPMTVKVSGTNCTSSLKDASMLDLASCPGEDAKTLYSTNSGQQALIDKGISLLTTNGANLKACAAPYKWFQLGTVGSPPDTNTTQPGCSGGSCTSVSYYAGAGCDTANPRLACPGGSGPQQRVGPKQNGSYGIENTNWVRDLYALGYQGYTWQYGDGVGLQSCNAGAKMTVTLCPNRGAPYAAKQWTFDQQKGTCIIAKTKADARLRSGQSAYPSLAACQQANMRYVCDDLTASDPFHVPGALWRADSGATKSGNYGYTYAQVQNLADLQCKPNFPVTGITGVTDVPICTYYYGGKELCPAHSQPPAP